MITRIMSKNEVIKQLEDLKIEAEYMSKSECADEIFSKDVIALKAAIYYLKEKRKEDIYIIKTSMLLTFVMLSIILFASIWCR